MKNEDQAMPCFEDYSESHRLWLEESFDFVEISSYHEIPSLRAHLPHTAFSKA